MPEALMAMTTSPGPGVGSGNSLSSSFRSPRKTMPRMRVGPPVDVRGERSVGSLGSVAYHLEIATTRRRARHDHRPLPVARAHVQLLVGERGRDLQIETEPDDAEPPARGIADSAPRARPHLRGLEARIGEAQRLRRARGVDDDARAEAVRAAVLATQPVEHELAPVVELEREPVPACELGAERARAPLPIHPGQACDFEAVAPYGDRAARGHAGQRVVVGSVARLGALAAQAAVALEDDRLPGVHGQVDGRLALAPAQSYG